MRGWNNKTGMNRYNFDKVIERRGSGALKTDRLKERFGRDDLTPAWVADMDFATPDFIVDAMKSRLEHPIFGYNVEPDDYRPSIIEWEKELHNWEINPEWISYIPGIVKGIGMVINVFTKRGDDVFIMPPVYHPFRITAELNGRRVVNVPLKEDADGKYEIDFEALQPNQEINIPIEGKYAQTLKITYLGKGSYEIENVTYPTYNPSIIAKYSEKT